MITREELIQNIKDCGQSLIDNAEKIVVDCKIQLGCPHSTLAQCFMIEPTDAMKPIILEKICYKHKMEE